MVDFNSILGKVQLEMVLFQFEGEPIVFILRKRSRARYLCINTGYGFEPSWLIARVSEKTIIRMIGDEISILNALSETKENVFMVYQRNGEIEYERKMFDDIEKSELPDADEKLNNYNLSDYVQQLQNEEIRKEYNPGKKQNQVIYAVDSPFIVQNDIDNYKEAKKIKAFEGKIEYAEG